MSKAKDLHYTCEDLAGSTNFLPDLDVECENKKTELAAYQKMQVEEVLALADTIKVLNDDLGTLQQDPQR